MRLIVRLVPIVSLCTYCAPFGRESRDGSHALLPLCSCSTLYLPPMYRINTGKMAEKYGGLVVSTTNGVQDVDNALRANDRVGG